MRMTNRSLCQFNRSAAATGCCKIYFAEVLFQFMESPLNGEIQIHPSSTYRLIFIISMWDECDSGDRYLRKTSHHYFSDPYRERTDRGKRVRSAAEVVGPPSRCGFGRISRPVQQGRCVSVFDSLHIFWSIFSAYRPFSKAAGTVSRRHVPRGHASLSASPNLIP